MAVASLWSCCILNAGSVADAASAESAQLPQFGRFILSELSSDDMESTKIELNND
ncbi:hypothetical protein [Glycomyces sp. MUSA5-2]|uniref:hypothetical protein n=1 Tax=Glycomyces sp. MUSA5-2 TaxID=2053002 RepID=UPI00300B2DB1